MESGNTNISSVFRSVDWITIIIYLILVVCGAVSIYAASYDFDQASMFDFSEYSGKQFVWIGLSFVIGFAILLIDKRMFETYAYLIYAIMILVLIATIFLARDIKGSKSWLEIGSISIQPAEFAKVATALALAKLFNAYNFVLNKSIKNYLKAGLIIGLPIIIIIMQKETGSALVYFSLILVLYREGMSGLVLFGALCAVVYFILTIKFTEAMILGIPSGEFAVLAIITLVYNIMLYKFCRTPETGRNVTIGILAASLITWILDLCGVEINGFIFFFAILGAITVYVLVMMFHENIRKMALAISFAVMSVMFMFSVNYVFSNVLEPHQQMRIKVALGIEEDLRGAGYNVNQSKIAIGSGGFIGKGFLNGTQTKLKYVPEQHTDFIFCTIGEEKGFVGSAFILLMFLALILRTISIAERQHTTFGRVYCYCIASYLIFHISINIGMVVGLCPVIGIPLPFLSYGGSALWGFTILLFIMLRIDAARKEYAQY